MTLRTVERLNGHRYELGEVYCSRCGVHVAEAEEKKCVPSTVEVLTVRKDNDGIPFPPTKPYRNLWDVQQP